MNYLKPIILGAFFIFSQGIYGAADSLTLAEKFAAAESFLESICTSETADYAKRVENAFFNPLQKELFVNYMQTLFTHPPHAFVLDLATMPDPFHILFIDTETYKAQIIPSEPYPLLRTLFKAPGHIAVPDCSVSIHIMPVDPEAASAICISPCGRLIGNPKQLLQNVRRTPNPNIFCYCHQLDDGPVQITEKMKLSFEDSKELLTKQKMD